MTEAVVLTIKTTHDGRICALTLSGALDFTTAAGFLEHVAQAVDDRTERFVLDLAGLAHLDCTGARALVLAAYTAPDGCPVIVRSISPPAARLLDLLNLDVRPLWQDTMLTTADPALPAASSSRRPVPGQAARAVACLTSGVASASVRQCPWLVVAIVTRLVTQTHTNCATFPRGHLGDTPGARR